ncbi:MAG: hypothetical protein KZQ93_05030 [Candidatus Thiodiazotropha sp. (ex Monitilora ramsayi)]|nr:hypothetical protein [Candidatus Thiodiazotropha sp. (ex Monitilora ramsayi)]
MKGKIVMLKKIVAFLLITLFFSDVLAVGHSGWTTVSEIRQGQGSTPLVKLTDSGNALCEPTQYVRINGADTDVGKRHFSTLLSALSSGKEVNIVTTDCANDGYALIDAIWIRN